MGQGPVDLDHAQGHQRARKHRRAGVALPHHAGSNTPGQQHSAALDAQAGSTILVPHISTSANVDIAPDVADNATMAFEAERAAGKSAKGYKLAKNNGKAQKAAPVTLVKARVQRNAVKAKPRRKNDN